MNKNSNNVHSAQCECGSGAGRGDAVGRVRAHADRAMRRGRTGISRLFLQRSVASGPQVLRPPVLSD